jgi:glycine/D-amino acid oxidase-like deaminating enzyme
MGCPMDYPGYNESPSLEGVGITAAVIASHLPRLHSASVQNVWAGLLPATPDTLPIIDRVPGHDGLIVATGHVFGNAAGPITGKLVAEIIAGDETSMDIAPFRIDRPFPARKNETAFW